METRKKLIEHGRTEHEHPNHYRIFEITLGGTDLQKEGEEGNCPYCGETYSYEGMRRHVIGTHKKPVNKFLEEHPEFGYEHLKKRSASRMTKIKSFRYLLEIKFYRRNKSYQVLAESKEELESLVLYYDKETEFLSAINDSEADLIRTKEHFEREVSKAVKRYLEEVKEPVGVGKY